MIKNDASVLEKIGRLVNITTLLQSLAVAVVRHEEASLYIDMCHQSILHTVINACIHNAC